MSIASCNPVSESPSINPDRLSEPRRVGDCVPDRFTCPLPRRHILRHLRVGRETVVGGPDTGRGGAPEVAPQHRRVDGERADDARQNDVIWSNDRQSHVPIWRHDRQQHVPNEGRVRASRGEGGLS